MILKYDEERHDYIVEDLDDENHLVIKESQLQNLKARLDQVCPFNLGSAGRYCCLSSASRSFLDTLQDLDEKIMQLDESESE